MNSTNKGMDAAVDPVAPTKKRTAVLVVHGMGSQRALDTVRGVVNSIWLDDEPSSKRYWMHPEKRDNDADLSVITTNEIPGTADNRSADFHELYWAHLMSETRAVAVLLWLFELVRKGPRLKRGMRALWWERRSIYACSFNPWCCSFCTAYCCCWAMLRLSTRRFSTVSFRKPQS
jgi:hypothetical protein